MVPGVIDEVMTVGDDPLRVAGVGVHPFSGQAEAGRDGVALQVVEDLTGEPEIGPGVEGVGDHSSGGVAAADGGGEGALQVDVPLDHSAGDQPGADPAGVAPP
jgi:hypothetical protein